MKSIFITRRIPEHGIALLKHAGYKVYVSNKNRALTRNELLQGVKGMDAVLSLLTDRIDAKVLDACGPKLKIIANYAAGFDNIDIAECKKRGIYVTNTPTFLSGYAVSEHTVALMFALSRRVIEADDYVRAGKYKGWDPYLFMGHTIFHKSLGIVGLGRIGIGVAEYVRGFGMRVHYYDAKRNKQAEKTYGLIYTPLKKLLRESDFITLHVPLLPSTRHLINKDTIEIMKDGAFLINTSRGPVIDERALVTAIKKRKIHGAALDVFEYEPDLAKGLAKLPNVVLTPHIASSTEEARIEMAECAAKNIIQALSGKKPKHRINS